MCISPIRNANWLSLTDRSRIGKHIAGHPRSYSSLESVSSDLRNRAHTFPPNAPNTTTIPNINVTDNTGDDTSKAHHTTSAPPDFSPRSPLPDIDLETGQEVTTPKNHWWTRKKKEDRQHSEYTQRAHEKTKWRLFKDILFSSWANLLLVFIPVGIALHFVNVSPTVVFVMNFLAIVPLAGVCVPVPELMRHFHFHRFLRELFLLWRHLC